MSKGIKRKADVLHTESDDESERELPDILADACGTSTTSANSSDEESDSDCSEMQCTGPFPTEPFTVGKVTFTAKMTVTQLLYHLILTVSGYLETLANVILMYET